MNNLERFRRQLDRACTPVRAISIKPKAEEINEVLERMERMK